MGVCPLLLASWTKAKILISVLAIAPGVRLFVIWKYVYVHLCGGSILVLENLNDSFPFGAHCFAVI